MENSAKQKAVEIVEKYEKEIGISDLNVLPDMNLSLSAETRTLAKQCALIAVDELWRELESERGFEKYDFWKQVRSEIEKL